MKTVMQDVTNKKAVWRFSKCQWRKNKKGKSRVTYQAGVYILGHIRQKIPESIGKDNLIKVSILFCHEHKIRQEGTDIRRQVFY